MVHKCLILNCGNTSKSTKMHVLPNNIEIRRKWCEAIQRTDLINVTGSQRHKYRICDVHFAGNAKFLQNRNKTNLRCDAIPTLNLQRKDQACPVEISVPEGFIMESDNPQFHGEASTSITQSIANIKHIGNIPDDRCSTPLGKRSRQSIQLLKIVGVTRASKLTPKAKKFYEIATSLKKVSRRLKFENDSNKKCISKAIESAESPIFLKSKLNSRSFNFLINQIKNQEKKSRGRRYTLDDKIYALTLLKQGPKAYKFLQQTFALPSRKILMELLNQIHFTCGTIPRIIKVFGESVQKLNILDRHCVLMFDEISIEPSLTYDRKWDSVIGFEDIDGTKRLRYADHALVFMLQGLRKKWKQPISYHFTQGGIKSADLKILIKNTIEILQNTGFIICCTVCDQGASNINAIQKLKLENPKKSATFDSFVIGGEEIVAVYDPPHLIKGIRNNLLSHNMTFIQNNRRKVAKWDHIVKLYELDVGDFNTRMCYKLTDAHLYKDKLKKMKVKHAVEVLSRRVSSTLRWTINHVPPEELPREAEDTADFITLFDQLFDSVNSVYSEAEYGKPLRGAIKEGSDHLNFWKESVTVLKSLKCTTNRGDTVPPSIKNWIKTLKGFEFLWEKLKSRGFEYLCLRRVNQDPLENFFGRIRSHGVRNINPSCYSFINSFKCLIINGFASPLSPGVNCEDDNVEILEPLKSMLVNDEKIGFMGNRFNER